ncbi:hypothetical protein SESBI_36595 [Sesbania bispinosa]|nr:hypothetical protein SESBI_36595 [Sesbania bispinosa]
MPEADPSSGRTFIWLITCILLICIIAGGACLGAYLVLPESEIAPWVPIAGVTLVCLPWIFWLITFLYRIFSRCCGFRFRVGIAIGGDDANAPTGNADVKDVAQANGSIGRTLSVASHDSEMPLAKSMVS